MVKIVHVKAFYVLGALHASAHAILITALRGHISIHLVDEKTDGVSKSSLPVQTASLSNIVPVLIVT